MAKIWYAHFDSTPEDKRLLLAEDWARYNRSLFTDGIKNGGDCLEVTAATGLSVNVNFGIAVIQGYILRVDDDENDSGKLINVLLPAANPSMDRIDRIVLRLDRRIERREIVVTYKIGTASSFPTPPLLERNSNIWELSLARVKVGANKSHILQSDITDERFDSNLCGLINTLLTLDSSSWQRLVEENINAQIARWESALNSEKDTWALQRAAYDAWLTSAKHDLESSVMFDFDNLASKPGTTRVTQFGNNIIVITLRNSFNYIRYAEKAMYFNSDGSIDSVENVYDSTGTVLLRTTSINTKFNADGTITEVTL